MRFVAAVRIITALAFAGVTVAARRFPVVTDALTLAAIVTVGIGHGAADDALLADRLASRGIGQRPIGIAYGLSAVVAFALAQRSARGTYIVLRALTWYHFGTGDAAFTRVADGRKRSPLTWIASGAVPLGAGARPARALGTSIAFAVALDDALRGAWGAAADSAIPALAFALAPTDRTFAAYFAFWHAPRHVAIVLERYAQGADVRARFARFVRAAAPNTAIALVAGGASMVFGRKPRASFEAAILAITVPHLVAVATLDVLTA